MIRRRLRPNRPLRCRFDGDLQLDVSLRDEVAIHYALQREYEPEVSRFIRRALRPGMVVFDVGANIGHFTLLAAKRVGAAGQVHAFEPAKSECDKLAANVALNGFGNVVVNRVAVCEQSGQVALQTLTDGLGLYNTLGRPFRSGEFASVMVPCTSLDDYVRERQIGRVDLIKIDIEGAEINALTGAAQLLSRDDAPVIVCEFSDPAATGMGHSTRELRREIEALGFRIFRYEMQSGALVEEPPREWYDYDNLVCAKRPIVLGDA